MAEQDPKDVVFMRHGEHGGVARTTRDAFDELWKGKGWSLAKDVTREQYEHDRRLRDLAAGEDLSKATKDTLVEVAGQLGRTVDPKASKAKLLETVENPVSPEDGTTTTAQK